jgi:hypothetical protein
MATEKFHWTSPAGVEIVLPHVDKIKGGAIRKYRKLPEIDMMFSILEDMLDEPTLAKIDDLDQKDLNDLFVAWQKAGASVGESSGSST